MPILNSNFLFYFLSGFLLFNAFIVITAQHSVFSLLFLILCFLCTSFLLFLLECEFLGLVFLIVYVGAIAVLFLFAVMMLNAKQQNLAKNFVKYLPAGIMFGLSFVAPLIYQISNVYNNIDKPLNYDKLYANSILSWVELIDSTSEFESYGLVLYSYFILQFLLVGLILLLVVIGVVYLINTFNTQQVTNQSIFKQLSVKTSFFS